MLKRVLDALERQTVPRDSFEVIVVGDPGEPRPRDVEQVIAAQPEGTRYLIRDGHSVGAARNLGWRETRAPIVLFLDDDVLPASELLAEHLSTHGEHRDETVGVLGRVTWARELEVTPFMRWLEAGIQFDFGSIEGDEAGWGRFYTANISLKRSLIARVGGFDEGHLPYLYEDLDLGYRLSRIGMRLLYNPDAFGEHLQAVDLDSWRRKIADVAVAERRFCRIHPEVEPYFRRRFSEAAEAPRARGRGARLARFIPRETTWIGARVWTAADLYWRQQLAPHFFSAWDAADAGDESSAAERSAQPDAAPSPPDEPRASSGGSAPSGPK